MIIMRCKIRHGGEGKGLKVTRAFRATWYAIVCLKHRRVCSSDSLEH